MTSARARPFGMLLVALGWLQSASPNLLDMAVSAHAGIDSPWPSLFESPWTALGVWLIGAVAATAAVFRPTRGVLGTYFCATVFMASHRLTGDDATFFGGVWVSAFLWWYAHTEARDPAYLRRVGPRLATLVLAAVFFPAGVGKAIPAYLSGAHFAELAGPDYHPVPRALGIPIDPVFYRFFSRAGLVVELSAPLWPLLPPRIAIPWVILVCLSMMGLWSTGLGSILLPVMGMAVIAFELATRAPPVQRPPNTQEHRGRRPNRRAPGP